jgi:hypothetical protein
MAYRGTLENLAVGGPSTAASYDLRVDDLLLPVDDRSPAAGRVDFQR